jgi:7-cyano-7-deazaguanine reductase
MVGKPYKTARRARHPATPKSRCRADAWSGIFLVSSIEPEERSMAHDVFQPDIQSTPIAEMDLYPLDTFPYEYVGREIEVSFSCPEFTAICPFSDFPDFATINLTYVPFERCVELKSLKLYVNSFRTVKVFHEHVVNKILEDFVAAVDPVRVVIEGDFNVRGNIKTVVRARYERPAAKPATA